MNLNKIKELENLREELSRVYSKRNKLFDEAKSSFLIESKQEFEDFFTKKEFNIEKSTTKDSDGNTCEVIEATYKDFKIEIIVPPSDVSYVGVNSVLVLNISRDKREYNLWVNEIGKNTRTNVSYPISKQGLSEDEKIDNEIKDSRNRLEDIKNNIEFNDIKFDIGIKGNDNEESSCDKFESLYKLLEYLFN